MAAMVYLMPSSCYLLLGVTLLIATAVYVIQCVIRTRGLVDYHPIQGKIEGIQNN